MIHNKSFAQFYLKTYTIKKNEAGQRLDYALKILFPNVGLRGRRRLWQYYKISVNAKECPQNYKVQTNDNISIEPMENCEPLSTKILRNNSICSINHVPYENSNILAKIDCNTKKKQGYLINKLRLSYLFPKDEAKVIQDTNNYIFLYKPSGLNSVSLSGSNIQSLESQLVRLIPDAKQAILANRLDKETSGIVVAVHKPEVLNLWRKIENQRLCKKHYLALVTGSIHNIMVIKNKLHTNDCKKTLVLPETIQNVLRHTTIEPLAHLELDSEQKLTLVGCTIQKGARHQIRAHLAYSGHALWGDAQYGKEEQFSFILHHCCLLFPQGKIVCQPKWLDNMAIPMQKAIVNWINTI